MKDTAARARRSKDSLPDSTSKSLGAPDGCGPNFYAELKKENRPEWNPHAAKLAVSFRDPAAIKQASMRAANTEALWKPAPKPFDKLPSQTGRRPQTSYSRPSPKHREQAGVAENRSGAGTRRVRSRHHSDHAD